jgi:hypothetical protein
MRPANLLFILSAEHSRDVSASTSWEWVHEEAWWG